MTDAVKALRALYDACHWVPSEQYVLTMDEQIALWDQAKEALAANEESADWYGLGVKDGRDGCLVELDALQARCDKLEAERNQVIRELIEKAKEIGASIHSPEFVTTDRSTGEAVLYSADLADWLKSQLEGGE